MAAQLQKPQNFFILNKYVREWSLYNLNLNCEALVQLFSFNK